MPRPMDSIPMSIDVPAYDCVVVSITSGYFSRMTINGSSMGSLAQGRQ